MLGSGVGSAQPRGCAADRELGTRGTRRALLSKHLAWETAVTANQSDPKMRAEPDASHTHKVRETDADGSIMDDLKEAGQMVSDVMLDQLSDLAADVGHEAQQTAQEVKDRGGHAIRRYAHAAHRAANELEDQSPHVAERVHAAASSVEKLSDKIQNRNVEFLMRDLQDLARTQPALFFGGAVAAGFAFARFMKSTGGHAHAGPHGASNREKMS